MRCAKVQSVHLQGGGETKVRSLQGTVAVEEVQALQGTDFELTCRRLCWDNDPAAQNTNT